MRRRLRAIGRALFTIVLAHWSLSASAAAPAEQPPAPPDLEAPLKARILVVDDDERNAFAAVEALADLGHELIVARSGEEALKQLLGEEFALILLDLHMPGMDGYETAALAPFILWGGSRDEEVYPGDQNCPLSSSRM